MNSAGVGEVQEKLRQLDVVFVIDTTGSMAPSIAEVKKRLRNLVHELVQSGVRPNVAFGTVAYRDHPPEDTSYVTRVYPLTEKVETAQRNIDELTARGGGDAPEAVIDGLHDALNVIKWREYAHKVALLVGDAPPHGMGGSGDKSASMGKLKESGFLGTIVSWFQELGDRWPEGCPRGLTSDNVIAQACAMGVTIHAVGAGSDKAMARSFRQIASVAGGEFLPLKKIDSLIDRILELLRTELGKVAMDIDVLDAWAVAGDRSAETLAARLEKPAAEVDESLKRLEIKGALTADDATAESFTAMLEQASGEDVPTTAQTAQGDIDVELLGQIKIIEDSSRADNAENDLEIRILDE